MNRLFLVVFFLISQSAVAQTEAAAPLVGVWKYFGKAFSPFRYREMQFVQGGYRSTGVYLLSEKGDPILEPYQPRSGVNAERADFTHWDKNPAKSAIEAAEHRSRPLPEGCNLLALNQMYALNTYLDRGIVNEDYIYTMLKDSEKLKPDQMTFFETERTEAGSMLKRRFGKIPEEARLRPNYKREMLRDMERRMAIERYINMLDGPNDLSADHFRRRAQHARWGKREYYDVTTSTVWLAGGQTPEGVAKLPLEYTSSPGGFQLDRKKYKAVWEVGRAASSRESDIWYGLKAAVDQAAHEAALLGVPEDEAWIVAHAPGRAMQKLHKRDYGLNFISSHPDGPNHAVSGGTIAEFRRAVEAKITEFNPELTEFYKPEGKIKTFQEISQYNFPLKSGVHFRNIKADLEKGIAPPSTWIEYEAEREGAMDGNYRIHSTAERQDQLSDRMYAYYNRARAGYMNPRWLDPLSYMKSRYGEEGALVIDHVGTRLGEEESRDVLKQAVGYAQEHGIKKIAIPGSMTQTGGISLPQGLKTESESIFWEMKKRETTKIMMFTIEKMVGRDVGAGITWINVDDALVFLKESKKPELLIPIERNWGQPLYSL